MHPSYAACVPVVTSQVEALRTEAAAAGDFEMVHVAGIALGLVDEDEMDRREARRECERVIRNTHREDQDMGVDHIRQAELLSGAEQTRRSVQRLAFRTLNDRGQGFDPTGIDSLWDLREHAATTDDVAVYRAQDAEGDEWVILVGTDGTGSEDSRWAVRVSAAGLDLDPS